MAKNVKAYRDPTHDEIAACAQRIYEQEGRPEGRAQEHWLQAEAQLIADRKAQAAAPPAKAESKPMPGNNSPAARTQSWQNSGRQPAHQN